MIPNLAAAPTSAIGRNAEETAAFRKVIWRIVPILTVALLLNNMDRTNVGFAALTMNRDLGMTAREFGWGAGVLFASYSFLEIPSNILLYRFGARIWLTRIMITWGLLSAGTAFVTGPYSFIILRFFLGVAEAGYFPGIIYVFACWFPAHYRTQIFAWSLLSSPVASLLSGPLAAAILPMNGFLGLAGWQWMFIIEGVPCVLLGIALPWVIADGPQKATWLTPRERDLVTGVLAAEDRDRPIESMWMAVRDIRVLVCAGIQFGFLLGSYGLAVWLPLMLRGRGLGNAAASLLSSLPFLLGCVALVCWARLVDRTGKRIANLVVACFLGAGGFFLSLVTHQQAFSYIGYTGLTLAVIGITTTRGLFWTIPPRILQGRGAAGGIAFINTIGTLGGFLGPVALGWLRTTTGSFNGGLAIMAGVLVISGLLSASLRFTMPKE
ncbi:MAG TPA: MFS transporter [Stellaceae bacterium]|jgi:MFS family permease|nr:MFS transporter [Stellaceae bacterium]